MSLAFDPDVVQYLELVKPLPAGALFVPPDIQAARQASASTQYAVETHPEKVQVSDLVCTSADGNIHVKMFKPVSLPHSPLAPAMMYVHGGGWVVGGVDDFAPVCSYLAEKSDSIVISVDYSLSPESKFPVAVNEVIAVWSWLVQNGASLGIDATRLSIAGDSAGGNLATVCVIDARNKKIQQPRAQILFYPVTDLGGESLSYARVIGGVPLTAQKMRWYREHYLNAEEDGFDWRASPLRASSLQGLPPTFIMTVGHDPLCDEGIAYAKRLQDEGGVVTHVHYSGVIHGFLRMAKIIHAGSAVLSFAAQYQQEMCAPCASESFGQEQT